MITLHVGGIKLSGWMEARVTASLESVYRECSFGVATAPAFDLASGWIRPGSAVTVEVDDQLVMTGYVVDDDYSYDKKSSSFEVTAASKTVDLVDSSVVDKPNRWRNAPLGKIIRDIIRPFKIPLVVGTGADVSQRIRRYKVTRGTKVYDALDQLIDDRGLLLTDDEQGRLVLLRMDAKNPPKSATTSIVQGPNGNVLKGRFKGSGAGLYSDYICKGQRSGSDTDYGASIALVSGSVTDQTLGRYRPLLIRPERRVDKKRAKDLARWRAANASGRAARLEYTVGGWTQADGSLWRPGLLVPVDDGRFGVEGDMLIVDVNWIKSPTDGEVTQLTLSPPAGYELLGPDERKKKKSKGQEKQWNSMDTFSVYKAIGDSIVISNDPRFVGIVTVFKDKE